MRPVTQAIYDIPSERVIGTTNALRYEPDEHGGSVVYEAQPDYFDDGPLKPVRIWSRIGRSMSWPPGTPTATSRCCGTSAGRRARLRLLVLHDDPEREFDYVAGAERALEEAKARRLDGGERQARLGDRVRLGSPAQSTRSKGQPETTACMGRPSTSAPKWTR